MALKVVVDSLEAIPETLRTEYEARDGKFFLKVDGDAEALVPGLVASKNALLTEKKTLAQQLKAFEGLDAAELRLLKKAQEEAEAERLKVQGDWAAREKQMTEHYEAKIASLEGVMSTKDKALYRNVIEREAIAAISGAGAKVRPLLPHVTAHLRMVEQKHGDEINYVARVVDAEGNPRIGDVKGGLGQPMTVAQLVDEFKADPEFQGNFPASGASGSGAPAGQRSGGEGQKQMRRAEFDGLGVTDKAAFMKSGGTLTD